MCRARTVSVKTDRVKYAGAELIVTGCPAHLPVLIDTARQALVTRAADHQPADGRRTGDVAAQVVADLIDQQDGAA